MLCYHFIKLIHSRTVKTIKIRLKRIYIRKINIHQFKLDNIPPKENDKYFDITMSRQTYTPM